MITLTDPTDHRLRRELSDTIAARVADLSALQDPVEDWTWAYMDEPPEPEEIPAEALAALLALDSRIWDGEPTAGIMAELAPLMG